MELRHKAVETQDVLMTMTEAKIAYGAFGARRRSDATPMASGQGEKRHESRPPSRGKGRAPPRPRGHAERYLQNAVEVQPLDPRNWILVIRTWPEEPEEPVRLDELREAEDPERQDVLREA